MLLDVHGVHDNMFALHHFARTGFPVQSVCNDGALAAM